MADPFLSQTHSSQSDEAHLDRPVQTFFRFLRFLLPYWDKVLLIVLAIIVASPLSQLQTLIAKNIFDDVLTNTLLPASERWHLIWVYVGIVAGALWLSRSIDVIRGLMTFFLDFHVTIDLRKTFYRHLHRLPFSFFQNRPVGEHMYRCLADVSGGGQGLVSMVTDQVPTAFRIMNDMLWQGALVFFFNPSAFWVILAFILPYSFFTYKMNSRIKRAFYAQRLQEQYVPAILRDSIAGVETLKSYGGNRQYARKFVRQLTRAFRATIKRDLLAHANNQIVIWFMSASLYGILWTYMLLQLMQGRITLGVFVLSYTATVRLVIPFRTLVDSWQTIRQQLVPAQRVLETLDVEPAIQDLPNAQPLPKVKGAIRFENVSFAYDPEVPILNNVSFTVTPGETLGIVGRSGAGKTTILNLLLRLHRPDSGRVLIDGHDLDKVRIDDWQEQLAIVLQDTMIFEGDVAYNVRYGKLKAKENEIWEALRVADADGFVEQMPQGVHSDLHEGAKLSGGQKQRIGIARAMVRNPRVLLLDEPTSSLDSRTENEIWRSFEKAMEDRTTLIISHRLATVRKADKIIVLVEGRMVEEGSHAELLERRGTYYQMWLEQTGQSEEEMSRGIAAIETKSFEQSYPKPIQASTPAAVLPPPEFGVAAAFANAHAHTPKSGNALDLVCQHELTPDLGAPVRTTRGQLKMIRFALRYLKPVWHLVLLHFTIVVPLTILAALVPWSEALIINRAQPEQNWRIFWFAIGMGFALQLLFTPGFLVQPPTFINVIVSWYMSTVIRLRMRIHFYRQLHRCSLRFFERRAIGEHMFRASADVDAMIGLITAQLPALLQSVLSFGFFLILSAWAISLKMTFAILLYLIPFYTCYHLIYSAIRKIEREQRKRSQRVDATLQEGVAGVKTVKAFARQRHEVRKFIGRHVHMYRIATARHWVDQINGILCGGNVFSPSVLPWIKMQIINLWTYSLVISKGLPVGTAKVVAGYTDQVAGPIVQILSLLNQVRLALIPAERVMETMSVEPMVIDKPNAKRAPDIQGALGFDDVRFSYDPGREVLKGMTFEIRPGESIGIVGPSGAGKSTLSKLALRLYALDSGRVMMDGWDIADVKMETYQKQVGTVMQETYLFVGSIRDNILFSNPNATEADIQAAIDAADLRDFIYGLPQGLNTNLAEGTRLSGGQKQRIGIARALIRQPRLMILDEPTASLDSTTEAEVMQTLWKVMEGRTTLIISHRLALVRPVDRILVVEDGRIVEEGSHDELLARRGLYALLWSEQYGEAVA